MSNNYYDEILDQISKCMEKKEYEEAYVLVQKELSMPYIPTDAEEKLKAFQKEIVFQRNENAKNTEVTLEEILDLLEEGTLEEQLVAALALSKRNIRECIPNVQAYLKKNACPQASAFLMDAIAEQNIHEEFTYEKDGIEYTFWGDAIETPSESKGFHQANKYLMDWIGSNPSLYQMAMQLLVDMVYQNLPLAYEEEEGEYLAAESIYKACQMMGDEQTWKEVAKKTKVLPMNKN